MPVVAQAMPVPQQARGIRLLGALEEGSDTIVTATGLLRAAGKQGATAVRVGIDATGSKVQMMCAGSSHLRNVDTMEKAGNPIPAETAAMSRNGLYHVVARNGKLSVYASFTPEQLHKDDMIFNPVALAISESGAVIYAAIGTGLGSLVKRISWRMSRVEFLRPEFGEHVSDIRCSHDGVVVALKYSRQNGAKKGIRVCLAPKGISECDIPVRGEFAYDMDGYGTCVAVADSHSLQVRTISSGETGPDALGGSPSRFFPGYASINLTRNVALSGDAKYVAAGSDLFSVRVWRVEDCQRIATLSWRLEHIGPAVPNVHVLPPTPLSEKEDDDRIREMYRTDSSLAQRPQSHYRPVSQTTASAARPPLLTGISISDKGDVVITGHDDRSARLWFLNPDEDAGPQQ